MLACAKDTLVQHLFLSTVVFSSYFFGFPDKLYYWFQKFFPEFLMLAKAWCTELWVVGRACVRF